MKGGQVSPEATMALNEMRQRTSAQEYGRFILEALKSTGLVGRPFNETPIGQAAALRGQPLEQQLAVNENDPAFGFVGTTVGRVGQAVNIRPLDILDSVRGEKFGYKELRVGDVPMAGADVSILGNEISIQNIMTRPEARRSGYARQLVESLMNEYPGKRVVVSNMTDDGAAFFRKSFDVAEDGTLTLKKKQ